ncbi:hypothetical protein [Christiangramia forsetii]
MGKKFGSVPEKDISFIKATLDDILRY